MIVCGRDIWKELRDIALLVLAGLLMTVLGWSCDHCVFNTRPFWIAASFTSLLWVVLWKGNDYVGSYISTRVSWIQYPVKRFVIGVVATFGFTFLALYGIISFYRWYFNSTVTSGIVFSVIITVIVSLFLYGKSFLENWRQTAIDAERLQKENIAARYESLKSQVNPHFLFNSFNALSNLVYEDQDKAVKFIKQLSDVYRYVLDTRDKEVVPLEEEISFLKSYAYLQGIRFGNKLNIVFEPGDVADMKVAPLALQMLMENAIKHNVVSEEDPLSIRVYIEGGFIVVENNLQKKASLGEPSTGIGLENICKRYEFLSSTAVAIVNDGVRFAVKLPVLKSVDS